MNSTQKAEENIIKAIKYELLGMCLDRELEKEIDFRKSSIYTKLYNKYGYTSEEISAALTKYQSVSEDPYLFPFEFPNVICTEDNYIMPLNELISFLEYHLSYVNLDEQKNNLNYPRQIFSVLFEDSIDNKYSLHGKKVLSLLSIEEIKKCKDLYDKYNDIILEIIIQKAKRNNPSNCEWIIKSIEELFKN